MIGALLIGGQSRRMHFPKHLLKWEGEPLGLHLCLLLREALGTDPLVVGDGPKIPGADRFESIQDYVPDGGPASGITSALDHAGNQDVLVLASDLPLMNLETLSWMIEEASKSTCDALWPKLSNRSFGEPLAAIYRPALKETMIQAMESSICRLTRIVPRHRRAEPRVPTDLHSAFTNVNTPREWARIKSNGQ